MNDDFLFNKLHSGIVERTGEVPSQSLIKRAYDLWKRSTTLISDPCSFAWSTEDKWTFKKLDFVPNEGKFEAWHEFLDRLSSPEDFMAFIWSIFEPRSKSRQYLYLYDPNGQGGKSSVLRVLSDILGNSCSAISNSSTGDASRWLLCNLYGKRLVVWPDCKNTKFCMSETLRNITSGDDVTVEFKGERPFSTRMYLKFIISSNHEPSITGGGADTSRLIRIDIAKNTKINDTQWEDRLRAELPHFLLACKRAYEAQCPNHGNISLSANTRELTDDSTSEVEEKFESICLTEFTFGPEREISPSAWQDIGKQHGFSSMDQKNFKDYLRQRHGCVIKREKVNGFKRTVYRGFSVRGRAPNCLA